MIAEIQNTITAAPGRCGPVPPVPMYRGCIGISNRTGLEESPSTPFSQLKPTPVGAVCNRTAFNPPGRGGLQPHRFGMSH